jgi:hypothetical protein
MLTEASRSLETLVDYAMTRWFLDKKSELIVLLKGYDPSALLAELQRRVHTPPPLEIEASAYCICEYALGPSAETWIRSRWEVYDPALFLSLAHASAFCLPHREGFRRVTEVLETLPARELYQGFPVLAHFQTALTLDWLETHIQRPVTDSWGRVAAQPQFSWERAVKWLDQGRPLSLVSLDALKHCKSLEAAHSTHHLILPWTFGMATREEMCDVLAAYAARDPAPRVKQAVAALLN